MNWFRKFPFLHRARLTRRAARLRGQRIRAIVPEPWMLPEHHCLIASFPRSGNTWLSCMVADVLMQQQGLTTGTKLPLNEREVIPDLDRGDLESCGHPDFAPRPIAKTHLPFLNWMQKGIFLVRRPADALTSFFHYNKKYTDLRAELENGIDAFCESHIEQWFAHAISYVWTCEQDPNNFIPVTYESLLEHPERELKRVLNHFEISFVGEQVERAVCNHKFGNYAKHQPELPVNERFYRKGTSHAADHELAIETLDWIQAVCGPVYQRAVELQSNATVKLAVAS